MCSLLQSSSEWSHLNPIRSGAARNTTPVKFSELNGPRMRRVIRIFLEIWSHNNYKRVRRLLDPALVFFFTDFSFHLLEIFSPNGSAGFYYFFGSLMNQDSPYQVSTGSSVLFQFIVLVCICGGVPKLTNMDYEKIIHELSSQKLVIRMILMI